MNQNGWYQMWCRPNGISRRFTKPKMPLAATGAPSVATVEKAFRPCCTGGHR